MTEVACAPVTAAPAESIGRRYAATVVGQGLQLVSSVIAAGVVPRVLGAAVYGNYSFLMNMAANIRGFTEPSAQQAFFTFSAQEDESGGLTRLYGTWVIVQLALLLGIVALVVLAGWTKLVWPGQRVDQIALITLLDWTTFLTLSLKQLGDSKGLTVKPQIIGVVAASLSIVGVLTLAATQLLTFYTYTFLNLATSAATALALGYWLIIVHRRWCWNGRLAAGAGAYLRRWWAYARPLILVEYYTPIIAALSTYLIQLWYGSVEQGQFALATRWSAVVLLFTSSAVMILWREIAAATAAGDDERAGQVYRRFDRLLAFVAMVLCTWLSVASPTLVRVLAGSQYLAAIPPVMVMAFYPLAQTVGQLSTAGLKAAGLTTEYRKWALLLSIPDIALTYLLVAPTTAPLPGLGLGALGVAIKTTGFALLSVQVYQWALMRHFGLSYQRLALGSIATLGVVVGVGGGVMLVLSRTAAAYLRAGAIASLFVASSGYLLVVIGIVIILPSFVGFSRGELVAAAARCFR